MVNIYAITKGRVYSAASTLSGQSNADAQAAGHKDVFDYVMSDSDHPRFLSFLAYINEVVPVGHRMILLDGLAQEYAGVDGWLAFVDREAPLD
jgi:hypothetical protein